jgi:predicted Zn finger-like uncharacterized protein
MPAVSYTCPKCRAVMKAANALPAGKAIRCPRCNHVFASSPPAASAGPVVSPAKRPAAPPIQRSRPSAPGVPQRNAGFSRRFAIRAGVLLLFVILLGAGGYFLWSSYGSSVLSQLGMKASSATQSEVAERDTSKEPSAATSPASQPVAAPLEALAYIPAESTVIAGVRLGSLLARPAIAALVEPVLKQDPDMKMFQEIEKATGLNFKDICDQSLIGVKLPLGPAARAGPEHVTAVYASKSPFAPEKLIPIISDGPARKINGRDWYPSKKSPPFTWVHVPSNRLLIFTNVPEDRLAVVFSGDGRKPLLDAEAVQLVRPLEKSQLWVVAPLDEAARQEIDKTLQPLQSAVPPDLKPAFDALRMAKALAVWGGVEGAQAKLNIGVVCADSKAALAATASLQDIWNKYGKKVLDEGPAKEMVENWPPYLQGLVKEYVGNAQFKQQDSMVQLALQVSVEPLETLIKEAITNPAFADSLKPPPPGTVNLNRERAELAKLTGELRTKNQQPAHKPNRKLDQAALAYAQKMAKQGKVDEVVDVQFVADNAQAAGYQFLALNASAAGGPAVTAQAVMKLWTDSKDAQQLMLDKQYQEIGVGVARDDKGALYYVQVYATHQK